MGIFDDAVTSIGDALQAAMDAVLSDAEPQMKLPFEIQQQQQSNWCWAACTVTIVEWYDGSSPWSQCQFVDAHVGLTDCCTDAGASEPCNRPNNTAAALKFAGHLEEDRAGTISFVALQQEVQSSRPIQIRIDWPKDSGAHAIVVDGYATAGDNQWVYGDDPASGDAFLYSYEAFKTKYAGIGTWARTRFTV